MDLRVARLALGRLLEVLERFGKAPFFLEC